MGSVDRQGGCGATAARNKRVTAVAIVVACGFAVWLTSLLLFV
jgi:hypothetical protein